MSEAGGYELIDVGGGRRLERFGARLVDRPAPGAIDPPLDPQAWRLASLRFDRAAGWRGSQEAVAPWTVTFDGLTLEVRTTTSGQLGVFPEHAASLAWLRDAVGHRVPARSSAPGRSSPLPQVLNLFAYTGLATLALAAAGAEVVHLDGSRPAVAWARRNAGLSRLASAPIRWIADDAQAFVTRELRRGRHYDGIVLDPPSWGHGRRGRGWSLDERLATLLDGCAALTGDRAGFLLLTTHTPGQDPATVSSAIARAMDVPTAEIEAGDLELRATSGAVLRLGTYARLDRKALRPRS